MEQLISYLQLFGENLPSGNMLSFFVLTSKHTKNYSMLRLTCAMNQASQ